MKRDTKDYLNDILEAITEINTFLSGIKDFAHFRSNREKVYSTIYLLVKIGEAVKSMPDSIKSKHPQIPWHDISGMRDVLTHAYFKTDLERVWETATRDLPPLKETIAKILKNS